jgi:hypothetical protein
MEKLIDCDILWGEYGVNITRIIYLFELYVATNSVG